jgi:hypothetical protein
MSIEWLLVKTTDTEAQKGLSKRHHEEGVLSSKAHSSTPRELNQGTEDGDKERQRRAEYFSSAKMQNRHSEVDLQCRCGYTGTVTPGKTDFKLLLTDKNGLVYFECPNCKQHLQYNSSTGESKIQKGFVGVLLRKFS